MSQNNALTHGKYYRGVKLDEATAEIMQTCDLCLKNLP